MGIQGISHLTFVVRDLARSRRFFEAVLDAQVVYESGDRTFSVAREVFVLVGGVWIAIMQGDPGQRRGYEHVAFKIEEADFDDYARRIREHGLELEEGRSRVEGEGRSLYFSDPDDHRFELHTGTLATRLARYRVD